MASDKDELAADGSTEVGLSLFSGVSSVTPTAILTRIALSTPGAGVVLFAMSLRKQLLPDSTGVS
jgi:hypothetical protein